MDTVLGVSITRISAGLVLLEGRTPDEVTVDRDAIDLTGHHASMKDVMAAVLGIQGTVSAHGDRLRAVGVTWSDDSEPKARELVTTLTEFGLTNIVPVRPAEAASTLVGNLQGNDADTTAPAAHTGEANAALVDGDVPLARGAALALARQATADTGQEGHPRRARRRPDPGSIAAATVLGGATLAVLAATWIGVAPRHADSNVPSPAPQQSAPPPLQVPPSASAVPSPVTETPQAATPVDTPAPAASHQLAPLGVQHLPHRPAAPSPAAPPPDGQEPGADDPQNPPGPVGDQPVLPGPAPGPPAAEPAPPGTAPAPDNQGTGPADGTAH